MTFKELQASFGDRVIVAITPKKETAEYGWLCDYETGNPMRPATEAELGESLQAAISDGGAGVIILSNGQAAFVSGEPTEAHEGYTDKW